MCCCGAPVGGMRIRENLSGLVNHSNRWRGAAVHDPSGVFRSLSFFQLAGIA
jgi:hypothetical protein